MMGSRLEQFSSRVAVLYRDIVRMHKQMLFETNVEDIDEKEIIESSEYDVVYHLLDYDIMVGKRDDMWMVLDEQHRPKHDGVEYMAFMGGMIIVKEPLRKKQPLGHVHEFTVES